MLELCFSLQGGRDLTSWLSQNPFGILKSTILVGGLVVNDNDFMKANRSLRIGFGLHVYNGYPKWSDDESKRGAPKITRIYDACAGPHRGTENIGQYIAASIDKSSQSKIRIGDAVKPKSGVCPQVAKVEKLVNVSLMASLSTDVNPTPAIYTALSSHHADPASADVLDGVDDIRSATGVIGINMITPGLKVQYMLPPTESLSPFVNDAIAEGTVSYADWATLSTWLGDTLVGWKVEYERVTVSEAETQGLWFISDKEAPCSRIRVHVSVVSAVEDGKLNMDKSANIVRDRVHSIVMSTQRDGIWASRTLPDNLGGKSLQYVDDVAAGRVVVAARNVVMDIEGMTSGEELRCQALKLLECAATKDPNNLDVPEIPFVQQQVIKVGIKTNSATPLEELNADRIMMTGIDTCFSVVLSVDWEIAAAGAGSYGTWALFDKYVLGKPGSGKGGKGRTVEFFFIVREVGGYRPIHMYVAELKTMVQAKSVLHVEVVGA